MSLAHRLAHERTAKLRYFASVTHQRASRVIVPADVTVMERDPSPCFMCGSAGGCRHRPWMLAG